MNKKNTARLYKKYDYMFRERTLDMSETTMCWNFSCDDGWYAIINNLCENITKELNKKGNEKLKEIFAVTQVKEKFGILRFYINISNKKIDSLILKAEKQSSQVCETCGMIGFKRPDLHWILVLCDKHYIEIKNRFNK